MQINIKDCIKNSLQKHVLSLIFVTYERLTTWRLRNNPLHVDLFECLTKRFSAVLKTHKRRSNKISKTEPTKIKI